MIDIFISFIITKIKLVYYRNNADVHRGTKYVAMARFFWVANSGAYLAFFGHERGRQALQKCSTAHGMAAY